MKVAELKPQPSKFEVFKRDRKIFTPEKSGCYVLTNFSKDIIYIGLTKNLQRRMNEHLDNPEKTSETKIGRPTFFFWLETTELNKLERTWLNIYIQNEGVLPELNKVYSPISS